MKSYAASTTLYVSGKTGNDWNTGLSPTPDVSGNGPLQTLAQAFSMIGQFRLDGLMQPYTVKLLDDLTELSSSVKVAPREDASY